MKKFFVFLIVILTVLSSVVTVSAVETSTSSSGAEHGGSSGKFGDDDTTTINLWSSSMFHHFFGDRNINENGEYKKYADDIFKSDGNVVKDSFAWFHCGGDGQPDFSGMDIYVTDGEFVVENNYPANDSEHYVSVSCRNYTYIGALRLSVFASSGKVSKFDYSHVPSFPQRYLKNIIYKDVSNLDISKSVTAYQCSNVYQSFLDYLNAGQYNFTDIKLLDGYKNLIKFYDQFDSPKGKYGVNYYDTPIENYVNSGVMFKDDVFYQNNKLDDDKKTFQISQLVDFYVIPSKNTQSLFDKMYLSNKLDSDVAKQAVANYLKDNSCALYYDESGTLETSDWYTEHIVNSQWIGSKYANFELGYWKGKRQYYIKFTMPDTYSRLENADKTSVILTGCHTKHSCQAVNPKTGEEISAGFGKNINNADNAKRPDKQELLDNGWQKGYPNTKGNYPYKITLNVNGEEYLYVYFANMPSVASNFFSDNCIQYGVNFYGTKGYFYDPVNNVSKEFDMTNFSTNETKDFNTKNYFGAASAKVRDPVDAIKDFLGSTSQSITADFLGIDISEFTNTFTAYFWTNYTGSLSAGYKGYYVQFNWRLEGNEHFRKNNSDDTHNYDDDYKKDDGQKDNNGNTHGGAVEDATTGNVYGDNNFRNDDFNFDDNTLWSYANQFLAFAAKCFTVLPEWVWMLIGSSFVIIIVLRLLGR